MAQSDQLGLYGNMSAFKETCSSGQMSQTHYEVAGGSLPSTVNEVIDP